MFDDIFAVGIRQQALYSTSRDDAYVAALTGKKNEHAGVGFTVADSPMVEEGEGEIEGIVVADVIYDDRDEFDLADGLATRSYFRNTSHLVAGKDTIGIGDESMCIRKAGIRDVGRLIVGPKG